MANVYRKIYLHIIFAVEGRKALLEKGWRDEAFKYIAGIINRRGHFSLAVNGHHNHIHLFFDYNPKELLSDLVREIKKASNLFINKQNYSTYKFEWQRGYGVFSHSASNKGKLIDYIINQDRHHRTTSFKEEYINLLDEYDIEFKLDYENIGNVIKIGEYLIY